MPEKLKIKWAKQHLKESRAKIIKVQNALKINKL